MPALSPAWVSYRDFQSSCNCADMKQRSWNETTCKRLHACIQFWHWIQIWNQGYPCCGNGHCSFKLWSVTNQHLDPGSQVDNFLAERSFEPYSWMLSGQVTFLTWPSLVRRFTVVVAVGDVFVDIMYTNFLSRHVVTTKLPLCRYLDSPRWSSPGKKVFCVITCTCPVSLYIYL